MVQYMKPGLYTGCECGTLLHKNVVGEAGDVAPIVVKEFGGKEYDFWECPGCGALVLKGEHNVKNKRTGVRNEGDEESSKGND